MQADQTKTVKQCRLNHSEWKQEHETILLSWRKIAAINMWLSLASKYMYERVNNWLAYPSVIMSVLTSIGVVGLDTCGDQSWANYLMSSVALVAAILTTINKHTGAAEKTHEFYVRSKEYYALIREIDYILALHIDDRPDAFETMVRLRAEMEKTIDNQMDFPLRIIREYEKKFKPVESSLFNMNLDSEKMEEGNKELDAVIAFRQSNMYEPGSSPLQKMRQASIAERFTAPRQKVRRSILMMPYQLYNPVGMSSPYDRARKQRGSIESYAPDVRIDINAITKEMQKPLGNESNRIINLGDLSTPSASFSVPGKP